VLAQGAAHYRDFGMGRSRGTMPIQLAGNVRQGGLFETAFGVTLGDLVDDIGGGTASGQPVRAVQVGGPLGAYFPRALFDTPFDYEAFAARDGLIGHGGIVVFDDTVDMAKQARLAMEFCAIEFYGKCTPCRIGSTRGVETMDRIIRGEDRAGNLAVLEDLCHTMKSSSDKDSCSRNLWLSIASWPQTDSGTDGRARLRRTGSSGPRERASLEAAAISSERRTGRRSRISTQERTRLRRGRRKCSRRMKRGGPPATSRGRRGW
jgi:NADH-ubiquinone oxidoreductase-F iron-sulfur binding region